MSITNRTPPSPGLSRAIERVLDTVVSGVQATAFWTAALLPLVLVGALVAGVAGASLDVVGGAAGLTLVSAAIGHGHSPS
jgi:hypothetical protein